MARNWRTALSLTLTTMVVLGSGIHAADGHIRAREAALEIRMSAIKWPEHQDGALLATPCSGCAVRSFGIGPETQLTWNGARVSLQALRERSRPSSIAAATIIYSRDTGRVFRIIAHD